jgi:hypothetical protein
MELLGKILHWIIDHATWDALVSLVEAHWEELGISAFVALVLSYVGLRPNPRIEIRFDYLPASPLNNGWTVAYGDFTTARWSSPSDAPVPGSISIDMDPGCAIETLLEPNATLSNRVKYSAKYSTATMLYMLVGLSSRDGSQTPQKWIRVDVGGGGPYRSSPGYDNEYKLPVEGTLQPNGWRKFDISLPDAVAKTWGTLGWTFRSLQKIRLRGNVAITPIELYQSRRWRR